MSRVIDLGSFNTNLRSANIHSKLDSIHIRPEQEAMKGDWKTAGGETLSAMNDFEKENEHAKNNKNEWEAVFTRFKTRR